MFTNVARRSWCTTREASAGALQGRGSTPVRGGTHTVVEIRAWLKEGDDSSFDHAFADGNVEDPSDMPERTRTGYGKHPSITLLTERSSLRVVSRQIVDSVKGTDSRSENHVFL